MIIGLSGYARAGKSEAANALREDGWEVRAYADKLREFLYVLNPMVHRIMEHDKFYNAVFVPSRRLQEVIDEHGWDGYKKTYYSEEIRRLIQTLGTDCGRNMLGENVWVDATLEPYIISPYREQWVIQDVRFPNEADAILDLGGKIIRINKPGVGPVNDHPSETALDDWQFDHLIENNGTVEQLHNSIRRLSRLYDGKPRVAGS